MNRVTEEHMRQALHDLYLSHERGEADFSPFNNGWKYCLAFHTLVELGEARKISTRPHQTFRITLLGLVVHRRSIEDTAA